MTDIQRLGLLFVLAPVAVFASAMLVVGVAIGVRDMWSSFRKR